MKQINTKYIESLKPCEDRFDNWKKHYGYKDLNLSDFLDLTEITHTDKLWVFFRSIPKKLIPLIAADFAEEVLPIFEKQYPNDLRPRQAIEAARSGVNAAHASYAAYHAAYRNNSASAYKVVSSVASAAAHAANAAANAAAHNIASYAAAYYVATTNADCVAAYYASYAAYYAYSADDNQEKVQIEIMKKYLRNL